MEKLLAAYSILAIPINIDLENISEALLGAFIIGKAKGYLESFEPGKMHTQLFEHYIRSKLSREDVVKERWGPRNKIMDELKEEAEKYYKNGGSSPHNDLAHAVKNNKKFGEKFLNLTLKEIRKVIGEVAEKYGLKKGIKK